MANSLDDLMPKILARGLLTLKSALVMPGLVNTSYKTDAARKGQNIDVPLPPTIAARDVAPGAVPVATPDITEDSTQIELSNWKEAPVKFTDKEQLEVVDDAAFMAVDAAAYALARAVNSSLFATYKGIGGYVGTAGTTPFGSDYTAASGARKVLNQQLAPLQNRRIVLDPDAEQKAIELGAFYKANESASDSVIKLGQIGTKLGFDWYMDQQVPSHTAGTITTGLIAKASTAVAAGLKTFVATTAASTGACALKAGDVIAIAGHTKTYALAADATQATAATDVTITITEGLEVALAGSEAVTVKADHVVNLAFNRDAFALAVRPLGQPQAPGSKVMTMVDSETGLPLRLEVSRQHKQDNWSFDILWGVKLVRPELACRIAG